MERWSKRAVLVALVAAMGACGRVDSVTAPEAARLDVRQSVLPDSVVSPPQDATMADSTGGRWGGYMGGGT